MKKLYFLCWVFIFLVSSILEGAIYFVDCKHPGAKDTNPGTEQLPFKTINGGLLHLKPGDTLYVKGGTYREALILTRNIKEYEKALAKYYQDWLKSQDWYKNCYVKEVSGKPGMIINIIGYLGEEVYVKGSDEVTGWRKYKDNIYVADWPYNSQQVFCDGKILQQIGGELYDMRKNYWLGKKGENIEDMIPGSFYYDTKEKKLYVWLEDNSDPNNHLIEASVRGILFLFQGAEYIRIANIKFYHSNSTYSPFWSVANLSRPTNNITLENVEISYTDGVALYISGYCNTVINSKFNWNGNTGIAGSGWGHRIINCETSYNNYRYFNPSWGAAGIKMIPYVHDVVVSGHISAYNRGLGIWFDEGCSSVTIQNCIIHHNEETGIAYEISNHGIIRNNIIYENKDAGIDIQDDSDNLVIHNLIYKNAGGGIRISAVEAPRGWWKEVFGREEDRGTWIRNNTIWGNILIDNGDSCGMHVRLEYDIVFPDPEIPRHYNNISDYNLFWRSDGKEVRIATGIVRFAYLRVLLKNEKVYTLKEWQEKTGNDKHSIIAEPKFLNLEKRDFRPVEGSPAIALVRPHISAAYDFENNLRLHPGKKPSYMTAGPFEFIK